MEKHPTPNELKERAFVGYRIATDQSAGVPDILQLLLRLTVRDLSGRLRALTASQDYAARQAREW
jgi:hypothetical protein